MTILESLIKNAKSTDYNADCFALLNCSAMVKNYQVAESEAFNYLQKILESTHSASNELSDAQKNACINAIQNLSDFTNNYSKYVDVNEANTKQLINEITQQCEANGYCYIPAGSNELLTLKISKNQNNTYDIRFLNHGLGVKNHTQLERSDDKVKYDYQSHVYRMDLNSEKAKLFFHDLLTQHLKDTNRSNIAIYGMLNLCGELQPDTLDERRAVTIQRANTNLLLTNARCTIKDTLISEHDLSLSKIKRYEFFHKLSSIVTAYKHLLENEAAQRDEFELELLSVALKELYVRLEKRHSIEIDDKELNEIRTYADKISTTLKQFKVAFVKEINKEKPLPPRVQEWVAKPLTPKIKIAEEAPPIKKKIKPVIRKDCPPNEFKAYLEEWKDAHRGSLISLLSLQQFFLSFPPRTGEETDPYWDKIPSDDLLKILELLCYFSTQCGDSCYFEKMLAMRLISYDIAAQIAPRMPELKLGTQFCLGLDDVFSKLTVVDPEVFLATSQVAKNFLKRSETRVPIFTAYLDDVSAINAYSKQFINPLHRAFLTSKLIAPTEKNYCDYFLTHYENEHDSWWSLFPEALVQLRRISGFAQGFERIAYTNETVYLQKQDQYCFSYQGSNIFSPSLSFLQGYKIRNGTTDIPSDRRMKTIYDSMLKILPPYQDTGIREEDGAENFIYQPENTKCLNHTYLSKEFFWWSQSQNGDLTGYTPQQKNTNAILDESLKRIQLDSTFSFQRSLVWLEMHFLDLLQDTMKCRELITNNLFQYGSIYQALENAPEETHALVHRVLSNAYSYFEKKLATEEKIGEVFRTYLLFVNLETYYRHWLSTLKQSHLLDESFPSCHATLQQLFVKYQTDTAYPLLAHSAVLNREMLSMDAFDLAAQLKIKMNNFFSTVRDHDEFFINLAGKNWSRYTIGLKHRLQNLTQEETNQFLKDMFSYMGLTNLADDSWTYDDKSFSFKNSEKEMDIQLDSGVLYSHNKPYIHDRLDTFKKMEMAKIFSMLGYDIEDIQFFRQEGDDFVKKNVNVFAYTPDGKAFDISYDKSGWGPIRITSFKHSIEVDNKTLEGELTSLADENNATSLLTEQSLNNPFGQSDTQCILWNSLAQDQFIIYDPNDKNKALISESKAGWQEIINVNGKWQKTNKVVLNTLDSNNELIKIWAAYFSVAPEKLRITGIYNQETNSMQVENVDLFDWNLHFKLQDKRLYSVEYPGFYLTADKGTSEDALNGLPTLIVLKNDKNQYKYLLPNSLLKANAFYAINPLSDNVNGYILLNKTHKGEFVGKKTEDNLKLAIIFASQGDYMRAMTCLNLSYTHKPNTQEILNMVFNYNRTKPDLPSSYAFFCHLYERIQAHKSKWAKTESAIDLSDEYKPLKEIYQENLAKYHQSISASREKVDIIPVFLQIKNSPFKHADYKSQVAFNDPNFSVTNHMEFKDTLFNLLQIKDETTFPPQSDLPFYLPSLKEIGDKRDFLSSHFHALFRLAISSSSIDNLRFNAYMYKIGADGGYLVGILRHIHHNKTLFSDNKNYLELIKTLEKKISTEIRLDNGTIVPDQRQFILNNPELFSSQVNPSQVKDSIKTPHWLTIEASHAFSLNSLQIHEVFKQPLLPLLNNFYAEPTIYTVADESTPFLVSDPTIKLSPIAQKTIQNYQEGFEYNKTLERKKFKLKSRPAELVDGLSAEISSNETTLARIRTEILTLANQLPEDSNDPSLQAQCDLIKGAWQSGKRNCLDVADFIACLLNQDLSVIKENNPFLSEAQINQLLQLSCNYALTSSKIDQCKDALALIPPKSDSLPSHVEQLVGAILEKQRTYSVTEYPQFLVYEYITGHRLRDEQVQKISQLITLIESNSLDTESYKTCLLQFAAGGGKTAVIIPILAQRFARLGFLPVIMNTNELYDIAEQEIPEKLKQIFGQQMEVIERELDFKWTIENAEQLFSDLERWRLGKKTLLLKSITWSSIDLAYKEARDQKNDSLAEVLKNVLNFFATKCVKLEDETHLISDPMQEAIRTDEPETVFTCQQTELMLDFYHVLIGENPEFANLVELTGIKEDSKKSVTSSELQTIKETLTKAILNKEVFKTLNSQDLEAYLLAASKVRPVWLSQLRETDPQLADTVIFARSFIHTHFPHILTLQLKRDYGTSIHSDDLTAAPKHDGENVTSHLADPLLVLALTTQMVFQQGLPKAYIKSVVEQLQNAWQKQKQANMSLSEAEVNLILLLPEKYALTPMDELNAESIMNDPDVTFSTPFIDKYLKEQAYPQVKAPRRHYASTPADLQAGFKRSILFTATPGLKETYPVQLKKENFLPAKEFEAEVISALLTDKNKEGVILNTINSPENFFKDLQENHALQFDKMTALLDRGALLVNFDNEKIAKAFQEILDNDIERANALFFDGNVMKLESKATGLQSVTIKGTQIIEALEEQGFSLESVMIFLFLDLARTTGTDVKRPYQDRAGLTIGKEQTLTHTIQAAMRERQLLNADAQSVVWIIFKNLYETINPNKPAFDLNQICLWMIENQSRQDEGKITTRAYQGLKLLIHQEAEKQVKEGGGPSFATEASYSEQVNLSLWERYEVPSEERNTDEVLTNYVDQQCRQYGLVRENLPQRVINQITTIVDETKQLIPKLASNVGSKITSEVVYQHQFEQQQMNEQETLLTINLEQINGYQNQTNIVFEIEKYTSEDKLESVFLGANNNYIPLSLPDVDFPNTPKILINPRHFTPIQQNDYKKITWLKPIDNLLIQCLPNGEYKYLACSAMGVKVFHEQIRAKKIDENSPAYILVKADGTELYSSDNCDTKRVEDCVHSELFSEAIAYVQLLNGHMEHTEKVADFLKKRQIDKVGFNQFIDKVKEIHVSPTPVDLADNPYLESLCGWKELPSIIQKRMAHFQSKPPLTKPPIPKTDKKMHPLPDVYLPDRMQTVVNPSILGEEFNNHLTMHELARKETRHVCWNSNSIPLATIIQNAVLKYRDYHLPRKNYNKNLSVYSRGPLGRLSLFRHGDKGLERANQLIRDIDKKNDQEVLKILDDFFTNSKTRYHRHSLSSFILDDISTFLYQNNEKKLSYNMNKRYHPIKAWEDANTKLDKIFDASIESPRSGLTTSEKTL